MDDWVWVWVMRVLGAAWIVASSIALIRTLDKPIDWRPSRQQTFPLPPTRTGYRVMYSGLLLSGFGMLVLSVLV